MLVALILCILATATSYSETEPANLISVGEAEMLVATQLHTIQPKLKEITTAEVRDRLGAQVFRIDTGYGGEAFMVRDRKVYRLGSAFGDRGLTQMCICDIDCDSHDELIFTYDCGSGLRRSCIAGYSFRGRAPAQISSSFHFVNAELMIEKRGNEDIDVYMRNGEPDKKLIGSLAIIGKDTKQFLDLKPAPDLPEECLSHIASSTLKPAITQRLDSSLACAARYMMRKQSPDGAWRSETYGFFRDGLSQTPLVLSCLFFLPQGGAKVQDSYRRGVDYLVSWVGEDGRIKAKEREILFPVLSSASASRVVVLQDRTAKTLQAQQAWLAYMRERQLNRAMGWEPSDPEFGGWGFALELPRKPATGKLRDMFVESNMVATIFGIAALRSAKLPADDPVWQDTLTFVERCQNYPAKPKDADERFDDGGFYFIPDDALQNKAGIAGKDKLGRERFHSYGSMTADGLRALIRCGLPPDHPRVQAALKWLERNFTVTDVPGTYEKDREILRNATYYYYVWAVAHAFAGLGLREIETKSGRIRWAEPLAEELLKRQKPDGSWTNRYTDAKEDDPLVATPWAAAALAICRESITGEVKELVPRRGATTHPAPRPAASGSAGTGGS